MQNKNCCYDHHEIISRMAVSPQLPHSGPTSSRAGRILMLPMAGWMEPQVVAVETLTPVARVARVARVVANSLLVFPRVQSKRRRSLSSPRCLQRSNHATQSWRMWRFGFVKLRHRCCPLAVCWFCFYFSPQNAINNDYDIRIWKWNRICSFNCFPFVLFIIPPSIDFMDLWG